MWEFHYTECGDFIKQNIGILLCRMWEFHYAECGDFIKQNVGILLSRLCFSGIKPQCMSLKKSKGNDIQSGTKHNFGYFQKSFPGLKP